MCFVEFFLSKEVSVFDFYGIFEEAVGHFECFNRLVKGKDEIFQVPEHWRKGAKCAAGLKNAYCRIDVGV